MMRKIALLILVLILAAGCEKQAPGGVVYEASEITEPSEPGTEPEMNKTIENETKNAEEKQLKTAVVELGYNSIEPQVLEIEKGTKVIWKNVDDIKPVHNIIDNMGVFKSGKMVFGDSYSFVFDKEGTYNYFDVGYKETEREEYIGTIIVS